MRSGFALAGGCLECELRCVCAQAGL